MNMRCPLCQSPVTDAGHDILDGMTLCEEWLNCPACGYRYTYAYGYIDTTILGVDFTWGWNDDPFNELTSRAASHFLFLSKQNWAAGLLTVAH